MDTMKVNQAPAETIKLKKVPLYKRRITAHMVRKALALVATLALVICICYVILYPLFTKVMVSFMEEQDLYDSTVNLIPRHFTLENYKMAWEGLEYIPSFVTTLILSLFVGIVSVISTSLVGYGFARFKFPLKKVLFVLMILTLLVPPQTIMVPLYMQFRYFDFNGLLGLFGIEPINMISTIWPIVLMNTFCMGLKSGLYIYLMQQTFRGIPREIEEAAYIDGAGTFKTFFSVVLPSTRPMMVTVFLFSFVWQWTETYYASMFLGNSVTVLSIKLEGLAANMAKIYTNFGGSLENISPGFRSLMNNTGSVLVLVPLIIVYLLCQRYFIEGIERSGIVG